MDLEKDGKSQKAEVPTIHLDQSEIDEFQMKKLNSANRLYRKCISGKCPKVDLLIEEVKRKTPKDLIDTNLKTLWSQKGRTHRMRDLEREISELETQLEIATSKPYAVSREKDFLAIGERIEGIKSKEEEIKRTKLDIQHLKSQIVRFDQKRDELSLQTESEDKFQIHLKKANREKEIMERKVEISRQNESMITLENRRLCQLIQNMLCDRAVFNFYWKSTVMKLRNRRKFLLDMIERTNQAFNQGAEHLENLKLLQLRRTLDRDRHIKEMTKMERRIDANETLNMYLGAKGKHRKLEPLEPREIKRREDFKTKYSNQLNLYGNIIENIKKFTGHRDIKIAMQHYEREENEGFQCFAYLNEMNKQIENLTINYLKTVKRNVNIDSQNRLQLKSFDERILDLKDELKSHIEATIKSKEDRDKYEDEILVFLRGIKDIMDILRCDYSPLESLLGNHKEITTLNLQKFLSILESRLNEILAVVYCDQRKPDEMLLDDEKLIVRSIRRAQPEMVNVEDIVVTQQCAECGESEDVNRYDDTIVYPHSEEVLNSNMASLVVKPEITFRLHNLSKCNLPRSGIIASRRFAE